MSRKSYGVFAASRRSKLKPYVAAISSGWQKATTSIIAVAKACAQANADLTPDEKRDLLKQLPFGLAVFSKLAAIGSDARLQDPALMNLLPPNYSIIYEVTHLSDDEIRRAVKGRVITPQVTRSEVIAFAKSSPGDVAKKPKLSRDDQVFFAEIRLPIGVDLTTQRKINEWLVELENTASAEVLRSTDLPIYDRLKARYERQLSAYQLSITKRMRMLLQKRISARKKRAKQSHQKWAFESDELDLNVPPSELDDRIREVLQILGIGDDYDELKAEAESLTNTRSMDSTAKKLEELFPFTYETKASLTVEIKKTRVGLAGMPSSEVKERLKKIKH